MTTATSALIFDGYNERAFIQEQRGLSPATRFEFRPTLLQELVSYRRDVANLKDMDLYRHAAKFLVGKLVSWDLQGRDGIAPISVETLLQFRSHAHFIRLLNIVLGQEPSDEDPKASQDERDQAAKDIKAAADGKTVGMVREGRDEKNS